MPPVLKIVVLVLVAIAATYDIRFRRIPNNLNICGVIAGITLNTFLFARTGIATAVLGCMLALAIYFPLYYLRAMGAGDVKLMAAIGSLVGPQLWIGIFVCTVIAGGILAGAVAITRRRFRDTMLNVAILVGELSRLRPPATHHAALDVKNTRSMRLPHGLTIAIGVLAFLLINR